jgi:Trk-type K+ transport system membrane component
VKPVERPDRYRPVLFFMVWFFLLSLYAVIVLWDERGTLTFNVALLVFFLSFLGTVGLVAKIRRELREELG